MEFLFGKRLRKRWTDLIEQDMEKLGVLTSEDVVISFFMMT